MEIAIILYHRLCTWVNRGRNILKIIQSAKWQTREAVADFVASVSPDLPLHVTRFFPRWRMADAEPTPVATVHRLADIARRRLSRVRLGNC